MLVGLCGLAGSGKDTVADFMVRNHGFVKVSFADPLKRICRDVFDFSDAQLWGPSEKRNAPDERYVRMKKGALGTLAGEPNPKEDVFLTPRYALQKLGTEWGRDCYPDVWIDYALRIASRLQKGGHVYSPQQGLSSVSFVGNEAEDAYERLKKSVVIPDVRFWNEIHAIHRAGGKVVKIVRKVVARFQGSPDGRVEELFSEDSYKTGGHRLVQHTTLEGEAAQHQSETELAAIPDEVFDNHLVNGGESLLFLEAATAGLVEVLG